MSKHKIISRDDCELFIENGLVNFSAIFFSYDDHDKLEITIPVKILSDILIRHLNKEVKENEMV